MEVYSALLGEYSSYTLSLSLDFLNSWTGVLVLKVVHLLYRSDDVTLQSIRNKEKDKLTRRIMPLVGEWQPRNSKGSQGRQLSKPVRRDS